jgi:hypothetical protein
MSDTQLRLSFHRSLYLPEAVKAAVEVYRPYAERIVVDDSAIEIVVTLEGFDTGYGDIIGDAFANHALFETVVRARETLGGVPV